MLGFIVACVIAPMIVPNSMPAQGWTQTMAPAEFWRSVACSSDGTRLIAAGDGGIYTSLDGGLTWLFLNATGSVSVACSTNGTRLIASASGGVYTSPDSGVTWSFHALTPDAQYYIASSAGGMKLAAVGYGGISGSMFISADAGNTWALPVAPSGFWLSNIWSSVAFSADGTKLVAAAEASTTGPGGSFQPGPIYISTNSGVSWSPTQAPSNVWYSVASSADGTVLAAAAYAGPSQVGGTGLIYTSVDSGTTWTPANPPSNYWNSIAVSADGTNLVATSLFDQSALNPGVIWRSTNSGVNWNEDTLTGYFNSVAISSDGSKLVAADVARNLIYTLGEPGATVPAFLPVLSAAPSENQLRLSWGISNTAGFSLTTTTNLTPPVTWLPVPNIPALGSNEIVLTLPVTNQSQFFRLKQQ